MKTISYTPITTLIKLLSILLLLTSILYPRANPIWLPNNTWKLVAYKGVYSDVTSPANWAEDSNRIIEDVADENTTFIVPNNDLSNFLYNRATGASATIDLGSNDTTEIDAVIGIFAIRGAHSPRASNPIELDGTQRNRVRMKIPIAKRKTRTLMYSMYVAGQNKKPAVRLIFQANYQGEKFRIKFGEEEETYVGYFDAQNTFDNPEILVDERLVSGNENRVKTANILDVVDFNISDNNVTLYINDRFNLEESVSRLSSADGDSLLAYHYDNKEGKWNIFNSANTDSESNSFTQLEEGKAYWMRAVVGRSTFDLNTTKAGLITTGKAQMDDDYLKNLPNRWNMMSFKDSHLRYATTGIRMRMADVTFTYILWEEPDGNSTAQGSKRSFTRLNGGGNQNVAKYYNTAVDVANLVYGLNIRMRAFPAMDMAGTRDIILLSDSRIYLAATGSEVNFRSLTGQRLQPLPIKDDATTPIGTFIGVRTSFDRDLFRSNYGEYIMVVRLNDLNLADGVDVNTSMKIAMPSISSQDREVTDLNQENDNIRRARLILREFNNTAQNAQGELRTEVDVSLIDVDIEDSHDYTAVATYDEILMAAGERFSIQDTTYTKAYRYVRNGDFKIVGERTIDITMENNVSFLDLAGEFLRTRDDTGVDFESLGQDADGDWYFSITSNRNSDLDLLENENNGTTLFEEIPLDSSMMPEDRRRLLRGSITKVFNIDNLLNAQVDINYPDVLSFTNDGTFQQAPILEMIYIALIDKMFTTFEFNGTFRGEVASMVEDLRSNAVWTMDFPKKSIINDFAVQGKEMESIMTADITDANEILWKHTDLSKDPDKWYGNTYNTDKQFDQDNQEVFTISSNKAYWVKLRDKPQRATTLNADSKLIQESTPHFDNSVPSTNNPISPVSNLIKGKLVIGFNNSFIDPLSNAFYNVIAIIDGKKYYLRAVGNDFQLDISSKDMLLAQKKAGEQGYPILIEAYNGLGDIFKEEVGSNRFTIDFVKPTTPKLQWNAIGELEVTNKGAYEIRAFANYISDVKKDRDDGAMEFNSTNPLSRFKKALGWEKESIETDDGVPTALRVVARNTKNNMYSDAKVTLYAPLKFGHILEVNTTNTRNSSTIPYSFMQNQPLVKQNPLNDNKILFDGTNGVNGGVQINRLKKAIDDKEGVKIVYFPAGGKAKEYSNNINAFGGRFAMYLKIDDTDREPIASITYVTDFAGAMFYVEYNNQLYMGRFAANDSFNTDSNAYVLKGNEEFSIEILQNLGQNINRYNINGSGAHINFGTQLPTQKMFNGIVPDGFTP